MAKRSWAVANEGSLSTVPARKSSFSSNPTETSSMLASNHHDGSDASEVPQISRKITACGTCRRLKIKCIMDERGPPCRRCEDRGLGCVLNKSLQSILEERTHYTDAIVHDLEEIHAFLDTIAGRIGLPKMAPLQSVSTIMGTANTSTSPLADRVVPSQRRLVAAEQTIGPSCDNSPELRPVDDDEFPHLPIQSLYKLTKMRALRSPEDSNKEDPYRAPIDDFIKLGAISQDDANRLFQLYRDRLDAFMYGVGCKYTSLDELRRKSPILTAATLTVAALHDPQGDTIYGACSSEFRRLAGATMFERRVDSDYLRALCIGTYWLSDMSWVLSGHAIRRASELNLQNSLEAAIDQQSSEAADCARLWFILNICDQHLAIQYGRPPIVSEDPSMKISEGFLESAVSNDEDKRLVSQVTLLNILMSIRELFGPDKGVVVPKTYVHQIAQFDEMLRQWLKKWSGTLKEQYTHIGTFPRKGVMLHFHFAQLHLHSHVFRGSSPNSPVPHYFLDSAISAVSSAIAGIEFILSDPDVGTGIVGMPSYLLGMTAFASTFLIKLAVKYGGQLVEPTQVYDLTTSLVRHFRSLKTAKWHLAGLMAGGLERMAATLKSSSASVVNGVQPQIDASLTGSTLGGEATVQMSGDAMAAMPMYGVHGPLLSLDTDFFFQPQMDLDFGNGFQMDYSSIR